MKEDLRQHVVKYLVAIVATVVAVVLRWLLDPWLGFYQPCTTLFGAIAATVWYGGYRPALVTTALGYLACNFLFMEPRGTVVLLHSHNYVGLVLYLFTGSLIIGFGEALRLAQRRAEEQSRKNQEIFSLVHSVGKIGHWEWNSLTDENKWSPEIEALYGLQPGSFERSYEAWSKLLHPDDLPKAEEDVRRALETGKYFTEFRVIWPDGSVHWLEARALVFKDDHQKPVRIMGVNMDVTERKEMEEALRQSDRRKDDFLAILAHELRNPLAPISSAVELLRLIDPHNAELQQLRDIIERQVTHMVRLVDDLLEVSRISRGKIELQRERVDLSRIVHHALETSRSFVETGRHELTVSMPPEPLPVEADVVRLTQVMTNLLNNAAKFTPEGGHIWFTVERRGNEAIVQVRDNGPGIPSDMLTKVFDLFTQVKTTGRRLQGGLGIGLALVRPLIEMHDGSIEAQSDGLGKGAEFTLHIPLAAARKEEEEPLTQQTDGQATSCSCYRILVVDDNVDAATVLSMFLSRSGHEVGTAYDGRTGIEQAMTFKPDLILLDLGMPEMDGFETARKVRALPEMSKIKLIALTGWGQDEDRKRTKEAGFDGHLVKPVAHAALRELLASLKDA